jgi:hypothetical protein
MVDDWRVMHVNGLCEPRVQRRELVGLRQAHKGQGKEQKQKGTDDTPDETTEGPETSKEERHAGAGPYVL